MISKPSGKFHILLILCLLNSLLFLGIESLTTSSIHERSLLADQYFYEARLQAEDNLTTALPFYRAAVRLNPNSVLFMFELADQEFKLELYSKAKSRIEKILKLDPGYQIALELLDAINNKTTFLNIALNDEKENFQFEMAPVMEFDKSVLHKFNALITIKDFDLIKSQPFVIKNAHERLSDVILADTNTLLSQLNLYFNESDVDFYPQNLLHKPEKVYHVQLEKALEFLHHPEVK